MKFSCLLLLVSLAGCAGAPYSPTKPASGAAAHLVMKERANYPFKPEFDGFIAVDSYDIKGGPVRDVWVAPGRRSISYSCPGWIVMDGPASLSHEFLADARYALSCDDPPAIQPVR